MSLTISQLYIRLDDGLAYDELLYVAQITPARLMKLSQASIIPSHPWHIDFALFLLLSRYGNCAITLRNELFALLDRDLTVPELASEFDRSPAPLFAVIREAVQKFELRGLRKAMRESGAQDARLIDLSRVALDFYTRLEEIIARRKQPRPQATLKVQITKE